MPRTTASHTPDTSASARPASISPASAMLPTPAMAPAMTPAPAMKRETPVTRRTFARGLAASLTTAGLTCAGLVVSLPQLVGCDDRHHNDDRNGDHADADSKGQRPRRPRAKSRLATAPFTVGPAAAYLQPGVYTDYWDERDVYLVSNGQHLIALAAVCTHLGCTVHWLAQQQLFECPCHESRFDANGTPQPEAKAKQPLHRCALSLVDEPQTGQPTGRTVIQVDPTRLFTADGPAGENFDAPRARLALPSA